MKRFALFHHNDKIDSVLNAALKFSQFIETARVPISCFGQFVRNDELAFVN
jgi:hypothetical protein